MATSRREQFTVRIDRQSGSGPAGVGFLIGRRQIVTCAHVVNTALGRPPRCTDHPKDSEVPVRFPMLHGLEDPLLRARVQSWSPPLPEGLIGGDVAGLVLVDDPPQGSDRARLFRGDLRNVSVELYGFPGNPPRRENGAWSSGTSRGRVGRGALQIDRATESALRTQPGYSGGPVVVPERDGSDQVAGMIVVASKDDDANDAYAVGIEHLSQYWPDAYTLSAHPDASEQARAKFTGQLRRILQAGASESGLLLPSQIASHPKRPEYREALNHHVDDLLAIWGKSGIFSAHRTSAFTPTHLIVANSKKVRNIPYENLPDYAVFEWTMKTRRGTHLHYGIRFVADEDNPFGPGDFQMLGKGCPDQPMVRMLEKISALILGTPEPTGPGAPARYTPYLMRSYRVRENRAS